MRAPAISAIGLLWALFSSVALLSPEASAELAIKKKVFDACPEALSAAEQLGEEDRRELVPYLVLVMKLKQESREPEQPFVPEPLVPDPHLNTLPLDEMRSPNLWHSLQPTRQIEARRCALELLKTITPVSLEALPDFLALIAEHTLPQDFAEQVREAAFAVAARSARDWHGQVPEKVLAGITDYVGGDESLLAENLLFELQESSVPYLVQRLKDSPPRKCDAVCRALLTMDPHGTVVGPKLIEILDTNDADLMMKVLPAVGRLTEAYQHSLPRLISLLKTSQGLLKNSLLLALQDIFANEQACLELKVSSQVTADLLQVLIATKGDERELYEKGLELLTARRPEALLEVVKQVNSAALEPHNKIRLIRVLARNELASSSAAAAGEPAIPLLVASDKALESLLGLFYEKDLSVRLNAITASGVYVRKRAQVLTAFLKLFKSNALEKDALVRERVALALAEGAKTLSPGRQKALIPYMLEALAAKSGLPADVTVYALPGQSEVLPSSSRPAAGFVLSANGEEALPGLYRLAQSKDPLLRERAAFVLGKIMPAHKAQIAVLGSLLTDQNEHVREESRLALISLGADSAPQVRKLLKSQDPAARLTAARILSEIGQGDPAVVSLLNTLLPKADCALRLTTGSWLHTLKGRLAEEALGALIECLPQASPEAQHQILEFSVAAAPLGQSSKEKLLALLKDPAVGNELQVKILNRTLEFGFQPETVIPLLLQIAQTSSSEALRLSALRAIGACKAEAQTAIPALKELLGSGTGGEHVQDQIVLTLSQIDATSIDVRAHLLTKLENGSGSEAAEFARALGGPIAVPALLEALHRLNGSTLYVALQTLGDIGKTATDALPELMRRLESKDLEERYYTLLALLKIDPLVGPVENALRSTLVMPKSHELLLEDLPRSVEPVLRNIAASARSRLETRNAEILLQRLRR